MTHPDPHQYLAQPHQTQTPHPAPSSYSTTTIPNPFPWWAHLIHAAGTVLTCGVWGIAWAIHYGVWPKTKLVRTTHWHQ